ncbi:MAG: oligoribonuclease [Acidobacteria bacterium]|nr:oligoribonuclease [Acidobacteriota bacterium]
MTNGIGGGAGVDPLVWIDMEMTGLHPESATILEIASVVTDGQLGVVAEGPDLVVHQSDAVLDSMDEWNTKHHGESGLISASRATTISIAEAERATLEFVRGHCAPGKSPLAGNSIGQDRRFLFKYMPGLEAFLHYRSVDVSSIKELARRWYPGLIPPEKRKAHRALDDILESIEELRFYREKVFR